MPRSILLRLTDIREAIQGIVGLTATCSYEIFAGDWAMQRAVERALEIISEASRHIPEEYKALAPNIPWRQNRRDRQPAAARMPARRRFGGVEHRY